MKDNLMPSVLPRLLESGSAQPNKFLLLDESHGDFLQRTNIGLDKLRRGEIRGEKVVVKVPHE
jgi:hypothetical protein